METRLRFFNSPKSVAGPAPAIAGPSRGVSPAGVTRSVTLTSTAPPYAPAPRTTRRSKTAFRRTTGQRLACPPTGVSAQLKNAFAGEKLKSFFALYAAVHDEMNAVGLRILRSSTNGPYFWGRHSARGRRQVNSPVRSSTDRQWPTGSEMSVRHTRLE